MAALDALNDLVCHVHVFVFICTGNFLSYRASVGMLARLSGASFRAVLSVARLSGARFQAVLSVARYECVE
jgi:hypothetical protein